MPSKVPDRLIRIEVLVRPNVWHPKLGLMTSDSQPPDDMGNLGPECKTFGMGNEW